MHYVASSGLALGADHGSAFGDPTQGFAQIASAAHKRNFEGVLVDVVGFVGGREHLGFVDRKSTRLNSSHVAISYAVFCLKKKKKKEIRGRSVGPRQRRLRH